MIGLADCWCGAKMQPTARAEVQTNAYLSTALFSSAVSVGQKLIDHHSVECSPLAEWVIEDEGYNGTVVNAHELPQLALQPVW